MIEDRCHGGALAVYSRHYLSSILYPPSSKQGRYLFCCTFRTRSGLAPFTSPPRYGAHHPAEFGLSSRPACNRLSRRPSDLLRRHYSCGRSDFQSRTWTVGCHDFRKRRQKVSTPSQSEANRPTAFPAQLPSHRLRCTHS